MYMIARSVTASNRSYSHMQLVSTSKKDEYLVYVHHEELGIRHVRQRLVYPDQYGSACLHN